MRDLRCRHNVSDSHPPARLEDSQNLLVNLQLVWSQVDYAVGDDHVHAGVFHRQLLDVPDAELRVLVVPRRRVLLSLCHHLGCHVHSDHFPGGADSLARQKGIEACAAAEIQDGVSGLHVCEGQRVAAPEPQVRRAAGRPHRPLLRTVTQPVARNVRNAALAFCSVRVTLLNGSVHTVRFLFAALLPQRTHAFTHDFRRQIASCQHLRLAAEHVYRHSRNLVDRKRIRNVLAVAVAQVNLQQRNSGQQACRQSGEQRLALLVLGCMENHHRKLEPLDVAAKVIFVDNVNDRRHRCGCLHYPLKIARSCCCCCC
mmetsp:Transcript_38604/g.64967  ORF Transcript_38604/g.64967 Transcript_38604/m.64967 type:complete len:313 (-) Transcript_38604:16-954(-)